MDMPAPSPVVSPPLPAQVRIADHEYWLEVRKGLLIIMRATMRRFGLTWADFLPKGMAVVEQGE